MNFKEKYPVLADCIYLDTASSGIISVETLEWRKNHDELFLNEGSYFRVQQAVFIDDVRGTISRFFNGQREHCFLVPNFSFGFNTFLQGLHRKSKFLLLDGDYPSVNYAVNINGFESETIDITVELETKLFEKIESFKPDVFACSLVQYINGYKIDLDLFKKLKQQFPNLMIAVDGTQFCGTESFDFKNSGVDFLGASGYKWMLAGYGNGFVLLTDWAADKIYHQAKKQPKATESFRSEKSTLSSFFEPGHLDTLSFGSLQQAILEREAIGEDFIKSKINKLGIIAAREFSERGILNSQLTETSTNQNIFNLKVPTEKILNLKEGGVVFTKRGEGIRVGFHFYNEESDVEKLLSIIDKNR